MCKHPVLVKTRCGDVDGDDVGGRVKTSAVEVVGGDDERSSGGDACGRS